MERQCKKVTWQYLNLSTSELAFHENKMHAHSLGQTFCPSMLYLSTRDIRAGEFCCGDGPKMFSTNPSPSYDKLQMSLNMTECLWWGEGQIPPFR